VRTASPLTDIVQLHVVMPEHMVAWNRGKVPAVIAQSGWVAVAYRNSSLNLSRDGAPWQLFDPYTRWRSGLDLLRAVILDKNLKPGRHVAKVQIALDHQAKAYGTALRVFPLLLN